MFENKKILALIPARGGSKRLPRKNILPLAGKPLIAWSIEAALASKYIDEVIVSTDDEDIASISKEYGAKVPFLRPQALALDETSSMDVVMHTMKFLEQKSKVYDYVVLLQPTSPLRNTTDIDKALELLFEKRALGIISVCESEHSPLWTNTLPKDNSMSDFLPKHNQKRSQDLPTFYRLNGAIYIAQANKLVNEQSFFLKENIFAYIMPNERSIDIDNKLDFTIAQTIMEHSLHEDS